MTAQGMVACPEPLAAQAGAAVLAGGGTAVDAAVAAAFAQAVTNPLASSLGGCGQFLVCRSGGEAEVIQASPVSGSRAVPGAYTPVDGGPIPGILGERRRVEGDRNLRGHSASVIPTLVRALEEAHRRGGRLPWGTLIEPAVRLARDGFAVAPYLFATWDPDRAHPMGVHPAAKIAAEPGARAIFMPGGRPLRTGERLVQRDLACTLERIARDGARVFYDGELGAAIGRDFEAHGGLFTTDDLRWAAPVLEAPLRGRYRDCELLTDEPPGLGIVLLMILQILERVDLRALGWNTPAYLDALARTMQFAFAEAAEVLGTAAGSRPAGAPAAAALLDPARAAAVRARVAAGESPPPAPAVLREGTTHLAVVDRDRTFVSWVHSSGSGSGVVTLGLGFVHNDHMVMFNPRPGRPDSIAPRTVPVHGGGPVVVLRGGRPWLAIGSPAGALKTTAITQVLLGVLEFGLPLQAAVASPRIHTQHGAVVVEPSFPSGLARALRHLGHSVVVSDYTARVSAVMDTGHGLAGGADPRGGGGLEWC